MTKAYSYLRFSTPEQMHGDSFRRQTALALDYCQKHKLTLDTEVTYNDLGVSAFRGKNSETGRLGEFLVGVRAGIIEQGSYLLVESLDRISRQAARKALRVLESICDEGITVVTLNDGKLYTREALDTDPMSLIMSLLVFIRSNEESLMKSKRLKSSWVGKRLKLAESGTPLTSRCPGWLELDRENERWIMDREKANIVRRIFREAAAGVGPHTIAENLNKDGVPVFGRGTQWHRSYVVKLLDESPAVIGTYVPHTMEYVEGKKVRKPLAPLPGYFPAAVDEVLYQKVRAMRSKSPSPLRGKATQVHNIFAGLVRCARCGSSMTLQNKGGTNPWRYLICTKARYGAGCQYTAVRYGEVESNFISESQRILALTPNSAEDYSDSLQSLQETMAVLQKRYQSLDDGWDRTRDPAMLEKMVPLREELETLRDRERALMAHMDATTGNLVQRRVNDLRKALSEPHKLNRASVNAMTRALFSGLSINPDSGVATIGWKHGGESAFTFGFPL